MTVPRKEMKREARREEKAEKASVLDKVSPYSLQYAIMLAASAVNIS